MELRYDNLAHTCVVKEKREKNIVFEGQKFLFFF